MLWSGAGPDAIQTRHDNHVHTPYLVTYLVSTDIEFVAEMCTMEASTTKTVAQETGWYQVNALRKDQSGLGEEVIVFDDKTTVDDNALDEAAAGHDKKL